jgi:hypothetical protein
MLNLSVQTKLSPKESLKKIEDYFVGEIGLSLAESVAHMHGANGSAEIRLYGGFTKEGKGDNSRDMLMVSAEHMQQKYGLIPVYYLYHFHTSPQNTIAHLVVTVSSKAPAEIHLQSEELDYDVKKFAQKVSKN